MVMPPRLDLQEHLADLEQKGLLRRIEHSVNKDTELHPLVRLQFIGGMREADRRAFLFTNVTDSSGRRYDMPVAVGAIAASAAICTGSNTTSARSRCRLQSSSAQHR